MKPFFSVIVPAYNAGVAILKCLKSINEQDFVNYEVIIINDGSSDNTEELVKDFIEDKTAFRLINTRNLGVSHARNLGLSNSSGKYIIFIDSDDWVLAGYFEYAYSKLKFNCDAIVFNYIEVRGGSKKYMNNGLSNSNLSHSDYEELFLLCVIQNNPWDKIFSRELFISNKLDFKSGISVGEDALLVFELLKMSKQIYFSKRAFVMYSINDEGASKSKVTNKKIKDILFVSNAIRNRVTESKLNYFHFYNVKLIYHYYMFSNTSESQEVNELRGLIFKSIKSASLSTVPSVKLKLFLLLLKASVLLKILPLFKSFRNRLKL